MKFLCVTCDSQMESVSAKGQSAEGTLSFVVRCPECNGQFAMLTNPMETKLLESLDVSLCPVGGKGRSESETGAPVVGRAEPVTPTAESSDSKCPFADMVAEDDARIADGAADLTWTVEAEGRLANVPTFVRPMARRGIEMFARERGYPEITVTVMDEAREVIGM